MPQHVKKQTIDKSNELLTIFSLSLQVTLFHNSQHAQNGSYPLVCLLILFDEYWKVLMMYEKHTFLFIYFVDVGVDLCSGFCVFNILFKNNILRSSSIIEGNGHGFWCYGQKHSRPCGWVNLITIVLVFPSRPKDLIPNICHLGHRIWWVRVHMQPV